MYRIVETYQTHLNMPCKGTLTQHSCQFVKQLVQLNTNDGLTLVGNPPPKAALWD